MVREALRAIEADQPISAPCSALIAAVRKEIDITTSLQCQGLVIRRELRPGDVEAIGDLHDRVYRNEYGAGEDWVYWERVRLEQHVARGWPRERALGSIWLVELDGALGGCLALVLRCPNVGNLDWFVLAPELRGRGLGRWLVSALIDEACARGMETLKVETFSALVAAARIYREAGFRVVWERETDFYGRRVMHQVYELALPPSVAQSSISV